MTIDPLYVVISLNSIWIAGYTFVWQADSKAKTANIKECVKESACIERMKALAMQEELKAEACHGELHKDIENIKKDIDKLKMFYGRHRHNRDSGVVEGGELL